MRERYSRRKRKPTMREKVRNFVKKIGTLNLILILVGLFFVWFNWQMLITYRQYGGIPESYACAVVAATIGECGICGWIRTNKDRHRDRLWEIEDREEAERMRREENEEGDGL
ncbi:MAG: hypothetical protein Q4B26_16270 [Eubacteriales bacterium]|nr:hypothetical protein [Eubacteriales bacterium]